MVCEMTKKSHENTFNEIHMKNSYENISNVVKKIPEICDVEERRKTSETKIFFNKTKKFSSKH